VALLIKRNVNESVLQYYSRLKQAVSDGALDLERSEIYSLLFPSLEPVSADHARKSLRVLDLCLDVDGCVIPTILSDSDESGVGKRVVVEINKDGSQSSGRIISMTESESKDADFLLRKHGYDAAEWELISAKSSIWDVQSKGGGTNTLYSSKITAKPKKIEWTIEDIDAYFETKIFKSARELTNPTNYDSSGEILEITLPDLHAGLYAWHKETGSNYDIHITRERFMKCLNDILERCKERKFEKIIFATLGDVLHVDNDQQTTGRGTFQQVDGRITKVFDITLDMLIDATILLGNFAPLEVIYVSGNHDRLLGYTLVKALEKAFRNDDNITFDITPNPRKFQRNENVLIGWLHGDCNKNHITEWIQTEARQDFGKSKFVEIHAGHFHHQQVIEKSGMIVRYLPTICASSAWEHQQAYGQNIKTVVSFVWNKWNGLREIWYSNI